MLMPDSSSARATRDESRLILAAFCVRLTGPPSGCGCARTGSAGRPDLCHGAHGAIHVAANALPGEGAPRRPWRTNSSLAQRGRAASPSPAAAICSMTEVLSTGLQTAAPPRPVAGNG